MGDEGSYQRNCQTNLVIFLHELSLLFFTYERASTLGNQSQMQLQSKLTRLYTNRSESLYCFGIAYTQQLTAWTDRSIHLLYQRAPCYEYADEDKTRSMLFGRMEKMIRGGMVRRESI